MREKVGALNGRLSNNLSGIAAIKSYTNEKYESESKILKKATSIEALIFQEAEKIGYAKSSKLEPQSFIVGEK